MNRIPFARYTAKHFDADCSAILANGSKMVISHCRMQRFLDTSIVHRRTLRAKIATLYGSSVAVPAVWVNTGGNVNPLVPITIGLALFCAIIHADLALTRNDRVQQKIIAKVRAQRLRDYATPAHNYTHPTLSEMSMITLYNDYEEIAGTTDELNHRADELRAIIARTRILQWQYYAEDTVATVIVASIATADVMLFCNGHSVIGAITTAMTIGIGLWIANSVASSGFSAGWGSVARRVKNDARRQLSQLSR